MDISTEATRKIYVYLTYLFFFSLCGFVDNPSFLGDKTTVDKLFVE